MKTKTIVLVVIALAIGVLVGFGIPRKGQPSGSGTGGTVKRNWAKSSKEVAYILPNEGPYYDLKWYGVSTELEKLGYSPQKYTAGAYKNVKAQTDIMENLIQKKVGAIILHSVDEKALAPFVDKAADAGIPVIAENVEVKSPNIAGSVQLANYQNGWELAMALVSVLHGEGKIVALIGPPGLEVTEEMWRGAKDYLSRFPKIQIIREEHLQVDTPEAQKVTDAILAANKDIKGIYTWYVQNGIGAALSVKNAGYQPGAIKIVAKDINPQGEQLLKDGYLTSLLVGEPIEMGRTSARMVDAILTGKDYNSNVLMRNRLIDATSLAAIDRSGFSGPTK
jgi:ABC-type sugar transport system substrate-binding protein